MVSFSPTSGRSNRAGRFFGFRLGRKAAEIFASSAETSDEASHDVLIVSQFYWPEPIGTAFYVTDLAKWFAQQGHRVRVLTGRPYYPYFRLMQGYESNRRDRETVDGVRIFRLPTLVPKEGRTIRRILSEANYLLQAAVRLATGRFRRGALVLSFSPSILTVLAGVLAMRRGARHVAVVHDIQSGLAAGLGMVRTLAFERIMRAVETFSLNRVDSVIVLSEAMKDRLRAQGVRRPIEVVPLWVNSDRIFPLPSGPQSSPILLYSGNFGRKQGLDQIVSLASVLTTDRPDARFVLRGSGLRAVELSRRTNAIGLKNVEFLPLLPFECFNEGLAEGDVHLVPQDPAAADFAVPSKVYNIMAAGRPFVCTASKGSTLWNLQRESDGFLCVPPNDVRAFADAVISLIDDRSLRTRLGANGRRYVEQTVSRDAVLWRYSRTLLNGSSPPQS